MAAGGLSHALLDEMTREGKKSARKDKTVRPARRHCVAPRGLASALLETTMKRALSIAAVTVCIATMACADDVVPNAYHDAIAIVDAAKVNEVRFIRDYKGRTFTDALTFRRLFRDRFNGGWRALFSNLPGPMRSTELVCRQIDNKTAMSMVDWKEERRVKVTGRIGDVILGDLELDDCGFDEPEDASSKDKREPRGQAKPEDAGKPHLSPSLRGELVALLREQFQACFVAPAGITVKPGAMSTIELQFSSVDGSLAGRPSIKSSPSDPGSRILTEAAVRAVSRCAPYKIPAQFAPFFDDWEEVIFQVNLD
jgi:hypothetical protein